jgi:hypothetical protein
MFLSADLTPSAGICSSGVVFAENALHLLQVLLIQRHRAVDTALVAANIRKKHASPCIKHLLDRSGALCFLSKLPLQSLRRRAQQAAVQNRKTVVQSTHRS